MHSYTRQQIETTGQIHSQADLPQKTSPISILQETGGLGVPTVGVDAAEKKTSLHPITELPLHHI